jgi:Domain of unknown function (DUF397)
VRPDIYAGQAWPLKLVGEGCPQSGGPIRFVDFFMFEAAAPDTGSFETTGERRICLMAAQPNRYSTLIWRKSNRSGESGGCVEVAKSGSFVLVRDSRKQSGAVLEFTCAQWLGLLRRIRNEERSGR